ncbi:MAG: hypothetical protein KC583_09130, partial [Myxococcales bacterium]|nr:hypothetical protein [Myxococcales bacterium]
MPCTRDEDCRDGYRCDLTLYAGQCVQNVYVFRCGPNLCRYGVEQCVEERCVRLVDGGMDGRDQGGGGAGGFGGQGGQGGQGGDPIDFGGAGGFDLGGGAGGGEPDAGEPLEAPRIVITAPFDGSTLLTEEPELVGQVFRLGGGTLRLVIDGEEPGQMLAPDADGRFRRTVRLNPGNHRLMVIAERGEDRVEEAVQIRIDAFVTTDGGGLRWGQRPFRFVGLSMPGLLDLAVANPEALDAVLAQAADLGATVIRTRAYDDRPMAASAIQTEPGAYAEPGLAALDLIVERAGFHGLKLILSLGDGGETYGGPTQYLRWAGYLVPVRTDQHLFFDAGPIR